MNTTDQLSMITESTFDKRMRRSMERLEERLARGERTVEIDIRELLHLIGLITSLDEGHRRLEAILFQRVKLWDDYNSAHLQPIVVPRGPVDKT